jgi:hypothetical protein
MLRESLSASQFRCLSHTAAPPPVCAEFNELTGGEHWVPSLPRACPIVSSRPLSNNRTSVSL